MADAKGFFTRNPSFFLQVHSKLSICL